MTRQRISAHLLPLLAMLGSAACGGRGDDTGPLRVAAASDLQVALPALAERFRAERGVAVEFVAGASGQLAAQVREGAPFDLFLSANRKFVDDLVEAGRIRADSVKPYARGELVLAVAGGAAGAQVGSIADLDRPEVKKIAIANPDFAPYGRAARQALERAGLWERLRGKVVIAETVRQATQYVESGNADAGLLSRATAAPAGLRTVAVDPGLYDPIVQALGVVAASRRRGDADAFAAFLLGEPGRKVLAGYGFAPP